MKLWYSIVNADDGSAYCSFFESKELAKVDHLGQEWSEECVDSISLPEFDLLSSPDIITKEAYFFICMEELMGEFISGDPYYTKEKVEGYLKLFDKPIEIISGEFKNDYINLKIKNQSILYYNYGKFKTLKDLQIHINNLFTESKNKLNESKN